MSPAQDAKEPTVELPELLLLLWSALVFWVLGQIWLVQISGCADVPARQRSDASGV
jgi:hypothetical protein